MVLFQTLDYLNRDLQQFRDDPGGLLGFRFRAGVDRAWGICGQPAGQRLASIPALLREMPIYRGYGWFDLGEAVFNQDKLDH